MLSSLGELTRRVRSAQRGTWFPLLLFGVLTLGGILVDRLTFTLQTVTCSPAPGSADIAPASCTLARQGSPVYWTLGVALAYGATAYFYVRQARSRGVGSPVRPYVIAGAALLALVAATTFWATRHGVPAPRTPIDFLGLHLDPASEFTQFLERFTGEAATIGLPLLVLAWAERNRALLSFALAYLLVELAPISTGWAGISATSPWSGLPRLALPAGFLLLGALGFALAQRARQRDAS
ncbi:hypothetical protein C7C46_01005 [Streptomyces tateyamensis]|uniref:Uncharacterized protein n=1 Tax=Streptomyces tateyamensis TaxID=565073 RepID=A0A2V4P0U5_9ACTN|nr:hypothetical protein C7C46_01005 [Streptomyces tateyamensis]